ncbi:MAG: threonine--tRNA ligase [candidate division WOR-3 bacterium]
MAKVIVKDKEGNIVGEIGKGGNLLGFKAQGLLYRADRAVYDLSVPVPEGITEVYLVDFDDPAGREAYWHTSSHILAQAVKELFPQAKLAIGPPIETGFYYDFDIGDGTFSPDDLSAIEKRAGEIIARDLEIKRFEMEKSEATRLFSDRGETYKTELLQEIPDEKVTVYAQGDFIDLCRGPHLASTGVVSRIKILSASGAYWRGDERGPRLQRIYGVSFPTEEELSDFLRRLEEAKRRDHRKLGAELDLFSFHEEAGPGVVIWHPKGALVRDIIEDYWRSVHREEGYEFIRSPHLFRSKLWETSGHLGFYRENMYVFNQDDEDYVIKPMNCPAHILVYKTRKRSYRDLPMRLAELGTVYRYERSGVLHGLFRVRGFTQDDAHIFCSQDQFIDEVRGVIRLTKRILRKFGFQDYKIDLSVKDPKKPEKYMGDEEGWVLAENGLAEALSAEGLSYEVQEGESAFYGPKIDIQLHDALGRRHQCTTIQVDFNIPTRFDVTYIGQDGLEHRVVMIHRAILGSIERFFGILLEHYGGAFPLWLAPVQVVVLPVVSGVNPYAAKITETLRAKGLRAEFDLRPERISYKIREAETQKVPYMAVVGKREAESGKVSVRKRGRGDMGPMALEEFIGMVLGELKGEENVS